MDNPDDGRNLLWRNDGVPLAVWLGVTEHHELSAADVVRLRLALDTLHAAEALETRIAAGDYGAARDELTAIREVRQSRANVDALVRSLTTTEPTRTSGPTPKPNAHRRNRTPRAQLRNGDLA